MDASDQLNGTKAEDFQIDVGLSNSCSHGIHPSSQNPLEMEDSTKLVGVQVVLILAYSTIILFGVTGNCLVIYVVHTFKKLQTVTNFFIVNLAVSDLLVNTLCLPFTLVYTLYDEWMFGQVLCYLLPCAQGMAVHVSTLTLIIIALDRYRSIIHHTEKKMSPMVCKVIILITWGFSALLASPLAIFREYGTFDLSPNRSVQVCTEEWAEGSMSGSVYSISMLIFQYCLPLAINSVAYIRVWGKLKSQETCGRQQGQRQRRKKTTKMLLMVVAVFAVSWLPLHAFQLAADIDSSVLYMTDFKLLFTMFHIVAMCSTCVNPILYGWMNNNYRRAFLSVCKCQQPVRIRRINRRTSANEVQVLADRKSSNL
ncbi:neuropeptide Y receptor type 2 [Synchiropus picturatus]